MTKKPFSYELLRKAFKTMETYLPPNRQLSMKMVALPVNDNGSGDISGGWLVAQMHLAGKNLAAVKAKGRVAASTINELVFYKHVVIGDEISCYAEVVRLDRTSLTLHIEAWAHNTLQEEDSKVTEGIFTFVAIDDNHNPRPIPKEQ